MITKEKSLSIEILNAVVLSFSLRRAVRQRQGHVNTPHKNKSETKLSWGWTPGRNQFQVLQPSRNHLTQRNKQKSKCFSVQYLWLSWQDPQLLAAQGSTIVAFSLFAALWSLHTQSRGVRKQGPNQQLSWWLNRRGASWPDETRYLEEPFIYWAITSAGLGQKVGPGILTFFEMKVALHKL